MNIIAVVGNVDGGKSSTIGVLVNNDNDNGNGSARETIMQHPHERCGRTSDINFVRFTNAITMIDLAGHEAYLKTTLRGLTTYTPNYAMVTVALNKGINPITCNHISVCRALKIPIFLVFTKFDISPSEITQKTIQDLIQFCKSNKCYIKFTYEIKDQKTLLNALTRYQESPQTVCPYLIVSNKTGYNIPLLKEFILRLPIAQLVRVENPQMDLNNDYTNLCNFATAKGITHLFHIYRPIHTRAFGHVLHGKQLIGTLKKGDTTRVGPIFGHYYSIKIRSIHNEDKTEINELLTGASGCLAFRSLNSSQPLITNRRNLSNGKVCLNTPVLIRQIRAEVLVVSHGFTMTKGYEGYLHFGTVSIGGRFLEADDFPLRPDKRSIVLIEFLSPQFCYPGARFIIRDGKIRGVAIVREVIA
jgi:elongation factor 1-alpha